MFSTPLVRQCRLSSINPRIVAEAVAMIVDRLLYDFTLLHGVQYAFELANLPIANMISVPMTLLVPNFVTPNGPSAFIPLIVVLWRAPSVPACRRADRNWPQFPRFWCGDASELSNFVPICRDDSFSRAKRAFCSTRWRVSAGIFGFRSKRSQAARESA